MKNNDLSSNILLTLFKVSSIALIIYLLFKLQSLLLYITIAAVISLIGRPIVIFLKSKFKLGNLFSASIAIFILVSILFGIIALFIPLLVQQGENLSLLDINALQKDIEKLIFEISMYFDLDKSFWESFLPDGKNFESISLSAIPKFLNNIFSLLGGLTIGFFSVIFISFFLSLLISLNPSSNFNCDGDRLTAVIRNNLNGDFAITNDLENIDKGAFIAVSYTHLTLPTKA